MYKIDHNLHTIKFNFISMLKFLFSSLASFYRHIINNVCSVFNHSSLNTLGRY